MSDTQDDRKVRLQDYATLGGYLLLTGVLALFALVLLRTAWLCDDAYITFRTVDNFVHGEGLRWNISERVQTYTHPLWMFLMSSVYFFTRENFLTGIFLSFSVSLSAVGLAAFSLPQKRTLAILAVVTLIFSRAFIDYSSSGLENPLTHLLLAFFLILFFKKEDRSSTLFLLSFTAALAALNRMDTILFFAPALLVAWWKNRSWKNTLLLAFGFTPFLAWELFSLVYYGFPFPNTAYAKLGTDIDRYELMRQGLAYFNYTLKHDALSLLVIALALISPIVARNKRYLPLVFGIALYLLYIIKVGGGFMGGRFFAAPFFVSTFLLARLWSRGHAVAWLPAFLIVLAIGLAQPFSPIMTDATFGIKRSKFVNGIANERMYYFQAASLTQWRAGKDTPKNKFADSGRKYRRLNRELTKVHGSMGFRGFFCGPKVHLIDYYALADPLLARLPAKYVPNWRIGHFQRTIPIGYPQSVATGVNHITDPQLAKFYEHLRRIISAPLWDRERWETIIKMNLGLYDHLIDRDAYRFPGMKHSTLQALSRPKKPGTAWNARGNIIISTNGLNIDLEESKHSPRFDISLDNNDTYRLLFMKDKQVVGKTTVKPYAKRRRGLALYEGLDVPRTAVEQGYDAIRVFPFPFDKYFSVGHLRLHDDTETQI